MHRIIYSVYLKVCLKLSLSVSSCFQIYITNVVVIRSDPAARVRILKLSFFYDFLNILKTTPTAPAEFLLAIRYLLFIFIKTIKKKIVTVQTLINRNQKLFVKR